MTSDSEQLRLAARGDEQAFLSLYRKHQGSLFRFALHMSGKVETAEEIVQEVFLSLLSAKHGFAEANGGLQAYLIGMARNMIRCRWKQERHFTDANLTASKSEEMIDEVSKQENLHDLRAAILSLPLNYREVVVLCDLEGLDYASAAEHLGCPLGTMRSRLHRARAILAAKLRKHLRCMA